MHNISQFKRKQKINVDNISLFYVLNVQTVFDYHENIEIYNEQSTSFFSLWFLNSMIDFTEFELIDVTRLEIQISKTWINSKLTKKIWKLNTISEFFVTRHFLLMKLLISITIRCFNRIVRWIFTIHVTMIRLLNRKKALTHVFV